MNPSKPSLAQHILGTRYLGGGPVYPGRLKAAGLEQGIPTPRQRERIDQISFDELVQARFSSPSRTHVQEEIGNLADQACDVVVLGCKQIPLRVMPESSALPIPDSTRCRASAVVSKAVGHA